MQIKNEMAWGGAQKEPRRRSQLRKRIRNRETSRIETIAGTRSEGIGFSHVYEKVGWGFNGGKAKRRERGKRPLLTVG